MGFIKKVKRSNLSDLLLASKWKWCGVDPSSWGVTYNNREHRVMPKFAIMHRTVKHLSETRNVQVLVIDDQWKRCQHPTKKENLRRKSFARLNSATKPRQDHTGLVAERGARRLGKICFSSFFLHPSEASYFCLQGLRRLKRVVYIK